MTESQHAGLPSWHLRLLERIHTVSNQHAKVLYHGYPDYVPADGRGEVTLQVWRSHLADLDTDRAELIARAHAVGVPEHLITTAHLTGTHQRPLPILAQVGEDWRRTLHADAVADDVWALEHMTAVAVERHLRGLDTDDTDAGLSERFHHNTTALSQRARASAAAAGFDATECRAQWDRDPVGWVRVFEHTVYRYSDTELDIRYRMQAWPGLAWDADRVTGNLAVPVRNVDGLAQLWEPRQMLAQASHARQADAAARAGIGHTSAEHAVYAALEGAGPTGWGIDAIAEPANPTAPERGPGPEVGL